MNLEEKSLNWIWLTFIAFFISYLIVGFIGKDLQYLWILLKIFSLGISIFLLIKNKFPRGKDLLMPTIFTVLYLLSTILRFSLLSLVSAITVFLSSCAVCSTFENISGKVFRWVICEKKYDFLLSILIGVVIGCVWGGINYLLMRKNYEIIGYSIWKSLLLSLNPAIFEEISCRAIFYAYCVNFMKHLPKTKKEDFTCWFMIIVPHILPHILLSFEKGFVESIINYIIILFLYIIVFGLVFGILQKKRDVLSAVIAHGIVDAIRFTVFGLI